MSIAERWHEVGERWTRGPEIQALQPKSCVASGTPLNFSIIVSTRKFYNYF